MSPRGPPLMQSRTVGHYEIIDKLGEGGMGVVWKARDQVLGRLTAIKVLPPAKAHDAERRERFIQEARTASSLNHPNIVTIHEIAKHGDQEYLVMEYVQGRTLDVLIGRQGLRLSVALDYATQIADALSAAHHAGIVHRDLKPGNIMVTDAGLVKVLDFGLAKLVDASARLSEEVTAEMPRTEEGIVLGTVGYMSPEQAEGQSIDPRSDIFSFGVLLYEMLTGRRPFQSDTRLATLAAIREQDPPALPAPVPRDVERVVLQCLRKEPARRWQSTADLKLALEELREESQRRKATGLAPRTVPRRAVPVLIAAAAVVGLAVIGFERFGGRFGLSYSDPVVVPLTTYQGSEIEPAISRDGKQVAFAWNGTGEDNYGIYVKLIGAGEPLRLTTDPRRHFQPKWSPDGQWIAFLRGQEGRYRFGVYLIPALGGAERKVGETSGQSLAWSPDGKSLLLSTSLTPGQPAGLVRLSVDTGETTTLTVPAVLQNDEGAIYSPDGQTLAFRRNLGPVGAASLLTMPSSVIAPTPDLVRTVNVPESISLGWFSWSASGRDLIYSAGWNPENAALWRVPASGSGLPVRLTFAGDGALTPDIAPAGDRLVFSRYLREMNIWSLTLDASGRAVGAPTPAFDSSMSEICPSFSPDGTKVAFESNRSGNDEVWICQSDGANCRQLTSFGTHAGSPAWSPDSQWIAFDAVGRTGGSVYVVNTNGGKPTWLEQGQLPRWSRDGAWIYYFKGSPAQIFRMPRSGGASQQVTTTGANTAEESPDGAWLYYSRSAGVGRTVLRRMPPSGGEPTEVLPEISGRNFAVVDTGIWYLIGRPTQGLFILYDLCFFDFASKSSRAIYRTSRPAYAGLTLAPDGRRLLFTQIDRSGSDLMLVERYR